MLRIPKKIRVLADVNRKELSKIIGVDRHSISNYENARCEIPVKVAKKYIQFAKDKGVLDIDLDEFYADN